jgi:hypothetical protein
VRRELVEPDNEQISVFRQCQLLGLNRTSLYYRGKPQSVEDGELMRLIKKSNHCLWQWFYEAVRRTGKHNKIYLLKLRTSKYIFRQL